MYALVDAVNVGWGSTATLAKIAGALVLLALFVAIERRQRAPLMPLSIFRLRTLRGADTVALLIGMSLFSMFFFVSLYMQQVLHYSALKAGLSYLPLAVGIILSAGAASAGVTRFGFKPVLLTGLLFVAGGLFWFSRVPPTVASFVADVLGPSLLAAVGLGLSFVPVTIAAVTGTRPHEAGLASGLVNTAQQVGGALGLAILATVANSRTKDLLHGGQPRPRVRADEGLRAGVPGRHRLRAHRRAADDRDDLLARQPRALPERPPGRAGGGLSGRRIALLPGRPATPPPGEGRPRGPAWTTLDPGCRHPTYSCSAAVGSSARRG